MSERLGSGVRPVALVLSAPSGAGKTTIARRLRERRGDVAFSISATTRPPRGYERDGVDYHFGSEDEFRRLIENGELIEWAEVHGNLYGTPLRNVREAQRRGEHLVLDIDIQGARQIRESLPEAVLVFVLPPSGEALVERLRGRGSEDESTVRRRLANACDEIRSAPEFDYIVINDELDAAVTDVERILDGRPAEVRSAPPLDRTVDHLTSAIERHLDPSDERV